jgi:predicted TIM-barrel fold metal-dependent hydrolase
MTLRQGISPEIGRIDVHHHMVPGFYLEAVAKAGMDTSSFPSWTPEKSLSMMDHLAISKAVLSLSPPGVWFGDAAGARELARKCNEYTGELVTRYPSRFGGLAILPFPGPEGVLEELAYALDTLRLTGVFLLSNVDGVYVGDPVSELLLAELNRRRAMVLLHPNHVRRGNENSALYSWVEYPLDVARVYLRLVYNDVFVRYPNISWILAHAGGAVPFLAERLGKAHYAKEGGLRWWRIIRDLAARRNGGLELAKGVSYETASFESPVVLAALRKLVEPEQILFGSNFPWDSELNA